MTNASVVSRGQLIAALCLALALVVGYLLADPMDSTGLAMLVLVVSFLSIPILMRWHHPLLIMSWNACVSPFFLPGHPMLWMLLAVVAFFFSVLNRATDSSRKFLNATPVNWAMALIVLVVVVTAAMTGGVGLQIFGSGHFGGKAYVNIASAILGYYAITSRAIPPERATLYVGFFFLSGITSLMSNLTYVAGPSWYFLFEFFPPEGALFQMISDFSPVETVTRFAGAPLATQAVWSFLLAIFGVEGILNFSRPWRFVLLLTAFTVGLWGGFRTAVLMFGLVFVILFFIERLWRTRAVFYVVFGMVTASTVLMLYAERLPLSVQRSVSFLPVRMDAATRLDAESSTEWRVEMWKKLLPEVPHYFFKGKGYVLNPQDMYLANESVLRGFMTSADVAAEAGDYHNGPFSVVIPFGIYGAVAFGWFFIAGLWVTWRNFHFGLPELKRINAFLFAMFLAKVIFFVVIFGSIHSDLFQFTGLIGLSVALNGGVRKDRPGAAES